MAVYVNLNAGVGKPLWEITLGEFSVWFKVGTSDCHSIVLRVTGNRWFCVLVSSDVIQHPDIYHPFLSQDFWKRNAYNAFYNVGLVSTTSRVCYRVFDFASVYRPSNAQNLGSIGATILHE